MRPAYSPYVSIVIIVLNGAETIEACLNSLAAQTYPQECFETIVVDNGSDDGTIDVVRQYPVRLVCEPVHGYSRARNAGIEAARGEIVAFIDADCVADADWLTELIQPYRDCRIAGVGGAVRMLPSANPTLVEQFVDESGFVETLPSPKANGILPHIVTRNAAYPKSILQQAGLFDLSLKACEDVDIARKVQLDLGAKIVLAPSAVVYHQHRRSGKSLMNFMRRDGYGEILMATRWKNYSDFQTDLPSELKRMAQQSITLLTYIRSFLFRSLVTRKKDRRYKIYPMLWFLAESANIVGKIQALVDTKMLRCIPTQKGALKR